MLSLLSQDARDMIDGYVKAEPNLTLSIGVSINDKRYFWVIDKGSVSNECSYLYSLGSITKIYTATLLAKLVCDGKMSLDDSIGQYLKISEPSATILDLATHFAYSPFRSFKNLFTLIFSTLGINVNFYSNETREKLLKYCNHHKLKLPRDHCYCDLNYALIGEAIGAVENDTYQSVMSDFLNKELGLTSTGFNPDGTSLESYRKRRKIGTIKWNDSNPYLSAGGLKTNIVDSLTFLEKCMFCNENYQVLAQTKRRMFKGLRARLGVGLGWNMYTSGKYLFHRGASAGFRTNYIFDKKKKIAISILANAKGNLDFNTTKLSIAIYKSLRKLPKEDSQ